MSASSLTGDSLTQMLSFSSMAAVVAGVPPEVALGSLAGAVIFVTSAVEYPVRRRVLLSILSFLCGLLFYKPTASILIGVASMIPTITQDSFERGILYSAGAFVAAIVAVRVGIWLYHRSDNPRDLIPGGKDDDRS
ncbi:putative holin [Klebsiella pneumoniae]|uniref:putative holin n=1 Tax=Klebsiella pneumoniae TaxID=573 RepID=UPI003B59B497